MKTLILQSDLMVEGAAAQLEEHRDRFILRMPEQPDYWFGNCVIFKAFSGDPEADIAQFQRDHPGAAHCCLQWDIPDLPPHPALERFTALGFDTDHADALALARSIIRFPLPENIAARQIISDQDWAQVIDLQVETGVEQGYDATQHPPYVRRRMAAHRAASESGRAAWFGLFEGDLLVADMGIYHADGLARYQSVETRKSHRKRGLCRALVSVCHDWVIARDSAARLLIVAETDGAAGRTYRACGFALAERHTSVVKGSY